MLVLLKPSTRLRILIAISVILFTLGVRLGMNARENCQEASSKLTPILRLDTKEMNVGIMVDVTDYDPQQVILCAEVLDGVGAKATWFFNATFIEKEQAILEKLASSGHEFGIKSTDDKPLDKADELTVKERIARCRRALQVLGIQPVPFYYAPQGRFGANLTEIAYKEGLAAVLGTFPPAGYRGDYNAAATAKAQAAKAGDIFVIRVTSKGTIPDLKFVRALLQGLSQRGLTPVGVLTLAKGIK